jgi:predicted nucleic acid-binding protein
MIFVDTGVWFAFAVESDPLHTAVASLLKQNIEPLVTTDFVVDETLTLLRARGKRLHAVESVRL